MGSFTQNDASRGNGTQRQPSENWGGYADAANRDFDSQVRKSSLAERDDQSVALLARAIQHEIIPRLMLAHRMPSECAGLPSSPRSKVTAQDVEYFSQMILSRNEERALACIEAVRARGATIESVYVDLLAPSARHLGQLWEDDLCDFTEVTIGLGRLQQMLHEMSPEFGTNATNGLRVLLLQTPGEQHSFGLSMVSEFFRRAGWEVAGGPYGGDSLTAKSVRDQHFDVVGFSMATDRHLEELSECIETVRRSSLNRRVCIMVGGPIFALHPEYCSQVKADLVANDGSAAPQLAQHFVSALAATP
jgi:methanogenic corrinoid protein MtbC1